MMMLMVLRHIKPMLLRYAGQDYTARGYLGRELPNLTVGIVGLGRIGETVARHLAGIRVPYFGLEPHAQSGICPILWKRWSWTSCFRAAISCRCT